MEVSTDVRIMEIVKDYDYLVNLNECLSIEDLKTRAQFCPGIVEEPELQELVQIAKHSTINTITRDSMGYWYTFKEKLNP